MKMTQMGTSKWISLSYEDWLVFPVSRGMTATAMKGKILRYPHMEDLSRKRKQTRGTKER
jgi:hypothetical protein